MTQRPESAVSIGSGLAGLTALLFLLVLGARCGWSALTMSLVLLCGTAITSALWDILVDRVHLRPSAGMNWSRPRPLSEISQIVLTKTIGLYATFSLIGIIYSVLHTYQSEDFRLFFWTISSCAPFVLALTPLYCILTTRYMVEPRDKLWHFGSLIMGARDSVALDQTRDYLLGWGIKSFFLPFLFSIILNVIYPFVNFSLTSLLVGIVPFFMAIVALMFLVDVCFGTVGYLMTFRPLDSHIRSSNPYLSAWVFTLICYPPFALMHGSGPLNYHVGGQKWSIWLADTPILLMIWGIAMAVLTSVYASATVIFGVRFSNLTNRGIVTVGPYRYFKHPAYLSKNIYWWFASMPFLTTSDSSTDAVRNSLLLGLVNLIYYMRAKAEEKHLMADPDYALYSAWIAEHGVIPRIRRRLRIAALGAGKRPPQPSK